MDETGQSEPPGGGIGGSFRRIAATLLSTLQNRIELFGLEWQEEREWFVATVIWAAALVFFSGAALTLATITIVFLFPIEARPYVMVSLCLAYLALTVGVAFGLRRRITEKPPAFKDSVSELKKDVSWLRPPE
jgi:uncharacterized membrane protein YqjE